MHGIDVATHRLSLDVVDHVAKLVVLALRYVSAVTGVPARRTR